MNNNNILTDDDLNEITGGTGHGQKTGRTSKLPPVTAALKPGYDPDSEFFCDNCGYSVKPGRNGNCPNCGCRLKKVTEIAEL